MSRPNLDVRPLAEDEVEAFHHDGYLVTRGALDAAAVAALQSWTLELSARPETRGEHWVYHELSQLDRETDLINRIENMYPFHEGFRGLGDVLAEPVAQLLGEKAVLFKDKINFKMPGGGGFEPHQDSQAGWEVYAPYFISVLVAIDEATVDNGCLLVAKRPDNHLIGRAWEPLSPEVTAAMDFGPLETAPGDVIYFDSYTPHASNPNRSNKIRRLYYGTYNRASDGDHRARYFADKHANYPPDIDRDPEREYVFRV